MQPKKHLVFPILTAVISLGAIYNICHFPTDVFSILSVLTGGTAIYLFSKDHPKYGLWMFIWINLQIPDIAWTSVTGEHIPLLSAFPNELLPFNFVFGFNMNLHRGSELLLSLNILPLALLYFARLHVVNHLTGQRISINRFNRDTFLQADLPVEGTIEKSIGRNKSNLIYQVKLDRAITISDKQYEYILIYPKETSRLRIHDKKQVCGLRICEIPDQPYRVNQHPFVYWIVVKTL
jgi:hypothetical protein